MPTPRKEKFVLGWEVMDSKTKGWVHAQIFASVHAKNIPKGIL